VSSTVLMNHDYQVQIQSNKKGITYIFLVPIIAIHA